MLPCCLRASSKHGITRDQIWLVTFHVLLSQRHAGNPEVAEWSLVHQSDGLEQRGQRRDVALQADVAHRGEE